MKKEPFVFRNEKCTPEEGAKECYTYTLFDRNKINITSEEEALSFEVIQLMICIWF